MIDDTPQNDTDAEVEEISQQLASLREDLSALTKSITGIIGRGGDSMAEELAAGLNDARRQAEHSGRSVEARLERSVLAHPLLAVGLAAAAGVLLGGSMARR